MSEPSSRRTLIVLGIIIVAVVGVLIAIFAVGNNSQSSSSASAPVTGVQDVSNLIGTIPQQGNVLGNPNAPVTLVAYEDLKCPICQRFNQSVFPGLVSTYIKTGKVRIIYEPQTFVGQQTAPGDSERAARFALAVGEQSKFWNFAELFYANQKDETTTYVTDAYLKSLGSKIPGLDVNKALSDMNSDQITQQLNTAKAQFSANNFNGTPSFTYGKTGGNMSVLPVKNLTIDEFTVPIDSLLQS